MSSRMDTIIPVDRLDNELNYLRTDNISQSDPSTNVEIRSVDAIESDIKTTHLPTDGFNVQRVYQAFVAALREPQNPKSPIGTRDYINGYRELIKFFDQLGYVFKFVKDDVVQKLIILQRFIDNDINNIKHFDTIQGAIDYETENSLISSNPQNFARTLLRLHRALHFIEEFLRDLNERVPSESTVTIATNAYDSTLYHYHNFLIRTTVKVGFRALPTREQLDKILFHDDKLGVIDQYKTFIKTIKQIYDTIQVYYAEKNYLQLP